MSEVKKESLKISLISLGVFLLVSVLFYLFAIFTSETNNNSLNNIIFFSVDGGILFLFLLHMLYSFIRIKQNKKNLLTNVTFKVMNYSFLLRQLVARDFKSKYKRSILGIFWSFLNPLLMMSVQYFVFSTIFSTSSINNYAVYLLIGVIIFNFVSESTSTGLTSITGNANLINKVYVPKYIYTLSKVISALINFVLSLIPLIIFMAITHVKVGPVYILVILDFFLLFCFCFGLSMLLATIMTFFRDMQFLWGIFITMWMYGTPIFYPIDMISNSTVQFILKMNPLYHYITCARSILIDASSPSLLSWGICIASALLMLLIGGLVFKKKQDEFILYV